ncbi:MAG TPA: hypothetical protein VHD61_08790 [Lacunisphaera sp.]|nr:hypothetical protein [Lacunisphaera sp.]
MSLRSIRRFLVRVLASPAPRVPAPLSARGRAAVLGVAAVLAAWVWAFHLRRFVGLGTTSDLYVGVQLATSWLDGRFLQDNFFGNFLAVHTSFFSLALGLLAYPFGAPGLLAGLGLAATASLVALVRILRQLGVPAGPALLAAALGMVMPLSAHVYQNDYRAFDVDLLEPALALWLASFLLERRWAGSLILALALISTKEDATLLAVAVAAVIWGEDAVRGLGSGAREKFCNWPAVAVAALALGALPLLLHLMKAQQGGAALDLAKVHAAGGAAIDGGAGLAAYVLGHLAPWLRSPTVSTWLALAGAATFGLIWLRPHLLGAGLLTTLVAWLVTYFPLLWPPRFAPSLAFFQLAGALAFASAWDVAAAARGPGRLRRAALGGALVLVVGALGWGLGRQWSAVPDTAQIYSLTPKLAISAADRRAADRLYALYRREGRRDEPVMASDYLFRYAHDRNLFWPQTLRHKPVPAWILWDTEEMPLLALRVILLTDQQVDLTAYELKGRAGRFLLYRHRAGRGGGDTLVPEFVPVSGAPAGGLHLKVSFPAGRAGHYEPLAALGPQGRGDLFFVHYLNERQLEVGMESMGATIFHSRVVEYAPGRDYELVLFSGTLAQPATGPTDPDEATYQAASRDLIRVEWEGESILEAQASPHAMGPDELHLAANMVRASSAEYAFSGQIKEAWRGGYPLAPAEELGARDLGAAWFVVWPPAAAAGVAEPLVVTGVPGRATLAYMRVLPGGKARLGVEFWGYGAFESDEVNVPSDAPALVVVHFPALYPPVGDARWAGVERALQEARRSQVSILVNGKVVLNRAAPDTGAPSAPVAFGENPVGGSLVLPRFSGRLQAGTRRLRLDAR